MGEALKPPDADQGSGEEEAAQVSARAPEPRTYMDNPPACGASKNRRWGYLPCGCHNDGYGRHVR